MEHLTIWIGSDQSGEVPVGLDPGKLGFVLHLVRLNKLLNMGQLWSDESWYGKPILPLPQPHKGLVIWSAPHGSKTLDAFRRRQPQRQQGTVKICNLYNSLITSEKKKHDKLS